MVGAAVARTNQVRPAAVTVTSVPETPGPTADHGRVANVAMIVKDVPERRTITGSPGEWTQFGTPLNAARSRVPRASRTSSGDADTMLIGMTSMSSVGGRVAAWPT